MLTMDRPDRLQLIHEVKGLTLCVSGRENATPALPDDHRICDMARCSSRRDLEQPNTLLVVEDR